MTDTTGRAAGTAGGDGDAFVTQVTWLIAATGGKDQLVARSGNRVSTRTLDNWAAGVYPRHKVTGAVRDLDAWAAANVPGYPEAAGAPRLTDSCGPYPVPWTPPEQGPGGSEAVTTPAVQGPPVPSGRRRWQRWGLIAAATVVVSAVSVVTTLFVDDMEDAAQASNPTAAAQSIAKTPLPSTGNGHEYTEQAGHIGANTFADPRTLLDGSQQIPPNTTIQVRCRYYAPSVPSVTPDGFWYLIDSGQWDGRWTPANSYMNGDVPGGPSLHNTDFAVPVCR